MLQVTLFATPSATEQNVRMMLSQEIIKADLDCQIVTVHDTSKFIEKDIEKVPTLSVGDDQVVYDDAAGVNDFVRRCMQQILKYAKHGRLRKILVPTDFSDSSSHALRFAIELAQRTNGLITLVHIYFPITTAVDGIVYVDPETEKTLRDKLHAYREEMEAKYTSLPGPVPLMEEEFLVGQAYKEIEKLVEQGKADMIVMGSTGTSDPVKKWLGSVSVSVARNANCPVFIIPPDAVYRPFQHIMVASDEPSLDPGMVKAIKHFTGRQQCELDVLHINEGNTKLVDEGLEIVDEGDDDSATSIMLYRKDLIASLHQYGERQGIDLIVMERKNRTIWQKLFHHSATREMTIKTEFPLLVLHQDDVKPFRS